MAFSMAASGNNVFDVGAFDAKTYFSELLRKVQNGAVINISKNGKQVAVLQGKQKIRNENAFNAHQRIMARSAKMAEFRNKYNLEKMTPQNIKELKDAGRKY